MSLEVFTLMKGYITVLPRTVCGFFVQPPQPTDGSGSLAVLADDWIWKHKASLCLSHPPTSERKSNKAPPRKMVPGSHKHTYPSRAPASAWIRTGCTHAALCCGVIFQSDHVKITKGWKCFVITERFSRVQAQVLLSVFWPGRVLFDLGLLKANSGSNEEESVFSRVVLVSAAGTRQASFGVVCLRDKLALRLCWFCEARIVNFKLIRWLPT